MDGRYRVLIRKERMSLVRVVTEADTDGDEEVPGGGVRLTTVR